MKSSATFSDTPEDRVLNNIVALTKRRGSHFCASPLWWHIAKTLCPDRPLPDAVRLLEDLVEKWIQPRSAQ